MRGAHARGTGAEKRLAARRRRTAGRDSEHELAAQRSTSPRPQDRLLSRSARQPREFAETVRHFGYQRVFNGYCYTGGFTLAALAGGAASGLGVDLGPALARALAHVGFNGFDASLAEFADDDVNQTLRRCVDQGTAFRCDRARPAEVRAHRRASRARRPGLQGHQSPGVHVARNGRRAVHVLVFRRSRHRAVPQDRRRRGYRCRRRWAILERLGAAPDHPMTVTFPEGEYLKGLVIIKR